MLPAWQGTSWDGTAALAGWDETSEEITRIRRRLADLDAERAELELVLEELEQKLASGSRAAERSSFTDAPVTNNSPSIEKIELFRRLFAGRPDVFPVRWENRTAGRSGYSPACSNEWAKGICGKPKVKCGECSHQAFIPPTVDIIEKLFLTMPIAWKGTLAQYVGRLHRLHDGKKDVLVVDYVDNAVPVLARMAAKRRAGYRALGYMIE